MTLLAVNSVLSSDEHRNQSVGHGRKVYDANHGPEGRVTVHGQCYLIISVD